MANLDFVGFDGETYCIQDFPFDVASDNHYIVFMSSFPQFIIFFFKEKFSFEKYNDTYLLCLDDNSYSSFDMYVDTPGFPCEVVTSIPNNTEATFIQDLPLRAIYSSSDISSGVRALDFTVGATFSIASMSKGSVYSSIEEIAPDMSSSVFGEIFGILPVILVVLISFIGLRKGISFLFNLLRRFLSRKDILC